MLELLRLGHIARSEVDSQRVFNCEHLKNKSQHFVGAACDSNTCPRPEVAFSNFPNGHHADCETQHCAGAIFASDTLHDQRWHSPTHSSWEISIVNAAGVIFVSDTIRCPR